MIIYKYLLLICALIIFAVIFVNSKSTYKDGNYSEAAGGCTRMCMRCHMGSLNPKGLTIKITSDKSSIIGGDTVTITATISGFSKDWRPGLALMADRYSQYASRTPQEYGWEILQNSNDNQFNFFKLQNNNDSVFFWKLRAPNYPGVYRLAVSGYFSDMSTGVPVQGTKRADNSLEITVSKADLPKPLIDFKNNPQIAYNNFYIYRFPVPLDSERVMAYKNGTIRKVDDTTDLDIENIWQTRDNKTIIIKTIQPMYSRFTYSFFYVMLTDYSPTPKGFTGNIFGKHNPEQYKIYAEFSQDVTEKEIKQHDRTEYLGNNGSEIHRINILFFLPDNPVDLLPVERIKKATLCLTPKIISKASQTQQTWTVTKLLPGTNWYEYFGNNLTVAANWSGCNPVSTPVASLIREVPSAIDTSDSGKWRWDITKDFVERFKNLGGSGTNTANYILRIAAQSEDSSTAGIGFYGSDADSSFNMPYIELELESEITSISEEVCFQKNLIISPNPATDYIEISVPNVILSETKEPEIKIFDVMGVEVNIGIDTPPAPSQECVRINVSHLAPGIYFVKVGDVVRKFVKM